ncbi:MAG: Uma2 family endonuclease, partial [Chloroflexi bacterium]|nr:Uma2 family endonuclease [Chloroflexota bacterium]
ARQHNDRITPDKLAGPADLIIEVVSDDSVARDRVDKFEEYEAAGVPEYWILDNRPGLRRPRAEVYQLDETGQYQFVPAGQDRIYRSRAVPGFWINLDWLWADPPPDPLLTFAEIAGLPPDLLARLRELKGQAASR